MQHHPKSHIITLSDWADATTALVRRFIYVTLEPYVTDPDTLQELANQWTMKHSVKWVQAFLDDEFNRQMKWSKGTTGADALILPYLTQIFRPHMGDKVDERKPQKQLLNDIIEMTDPVVIVIGEFVIEMVSSNPWWVWSIRFNYDVALIESDEDYRVKVFHEKIDSGDWSLA